MKEIFLDHGLKAYIDNEDFDRVSKHKWHADFSVDGLRVYARSTFYISKHKKKNIRLHRFVMKAKPGQIVDHKGGNSTTLDCRKSNLRICSKSQNASNSKINKRNTSGFRGVSFHPGTGKWRASIVVDGKRKSLGLYFSPQEASKIVECTRKIQWG